MVRIAYKEAERLDLGIARLFNAGKIQGKFPVGSVPLKTWTIGMNGLTLFVDINATQLLRMHCFALSGLKKQDCFARRGFYRLLVIPGAIRVSLPWIRWDRGSIFWHDPTGRRKPGIFT
jgi:hypothetical protein